MALIDVVGVATRPNPDEYIRGFSLEFPKPGAALDVYALNIEGWFVPRSEPAELMLEVPGKAPEALACNVFRDDLASAYPEVPSATHCGFATSRNVINFPQEFELYLKMARPGQEDVWLASVHCRRQPLSVAEEPRFIPVMLTTMGRTGGTWVTHLIGCHPEIATMRPFEYESRIASYWMDAFASLVEPKSYFQSIGAGGSEGTHWWLGDERAAGNWGWMLRDPDELSADDRANAMWFGRENVEQTLSAFLDRIAKTYERVAHDKSDARCFMERYWADSAAQHIMSEVYPSSREIVLVRDPRDMVASILAFNKKRNKQLFGRDAWDSDEEYIRSDFMTKQLRGLLDVYTARSHMNYLLRYEDLVTRTEETLHSVLTYLGVDSSPAVIQEMLETSAAQSADAQTDHRTTGTAEASIGRWRRDLDEELQAACAEVFGDVLVELGYETALSEPAKSSV